MKCPICGKDKKYLEKHHLIPKKLKCKDKELKNMIINICRICHTKLHKGRTIDDAEIGRRECIY